MQRRSIPIPIPPAGGIPCSRGGQKVFVELLLFSAGLLLEAFALFDGIILLGVRGGDFLSVDAALENLHAIGLIGGELGEGYEFFREVRHEGWLDEGGFDKFFKDRVSDFKVLFRWGRFQLSTDRRHGRGVDRA